jgi:hypothetical protein
MASSENKIVLPSKPLGMLCTWSPYACEALGPTGRWLFPSTTSSSESADCLTSPSLLSPSSSELRHTPDQTSATTAPTSATPPGTTLPTAGLVFALHANHPPLCSSWCAPALPLKGHHPMAAAYAAKRPTLPSRRPHSLVAFEISQLVCGLWVVNKCFDALLLFGTATCSHAKHSTQQECHL